jgi:hypothetical protein
MSTERRIKARYPLEMAVHYRTLSSKPISGAGRTVNVSSNGVLIAAEHDLEEGARLRLTMEWPTLLDGITPLQLVTTGKVVRHKDAKIAVAFDWYQFRTMKRAGSIPMTKTFTTAALTGSPVLSNGGAVRTPGIPLRNAG